MAPREDENNAYAKFWADKQRALLYVMVFSGMVNCSLINPSDVKVSRPKMPGCIFQHSVFKNFPGDLVPRPL